MEVGEAVMLLKSNDSAARLRATGALLDAQEGGGDIGAAEGALLGALSDRDGEFRCSAARLLAGFYGRKRRWADLDKMLGHARPDVRAAAVYKLGGFIGQFDIRSDTPALARALDDNDFELRKEAAVFFEKASAAGLDISFAVPGLRKAIVYGDDRMKEAAANAIKTFEMRKGGGERCPKCLDLEAGTEPGEAAKAFEDLALIIKSISCCGGDVTHRVFRCASCGKHYLSTYFDHSDYDHGQLSIMLVPKEEAERIAAEFRKCPAPEGKACRCGVHTEYLKDEKVPAGGKLVYSFERRD